MFGVLVFWVCLVHLCFMSTSPDTVQGKVHLHHGPTSPPAGGHCSVDRPAGCNGVPDSQLLETEEDVYETLWTRNKDVATAIWNLPFLQKMKSGELPSNLYVNFMVQDILYLLEVSNMLKDMSEYVQDPEDIRVFMESSYNSYNRYATHILEDLKFKAVPQICPTPAVQRYLQSYRDLLKRYKNQPIFFAVSLLPCSRLWTWLGSRLDVPPQHPYYFWQEDNKDGHAERHFKKLLNTHLKTKDDIETANFIFHKQMEHELSFFEESYRPRT